MFYLIHAVFAIPAVYLVIRFVWPLPWPMAVKVAVGILLLAASQFHFWSRLSSGSPFLPEFPRRVVALFNWAIGAIILLALMQVALDLAGLVGMLVQGHFWSPPYVAKYSIAVAAMLAAAIGVQQAMRVPPVRDVDVPIENLPQDFDGYTILQLTDLHISRLFPERWTRAVVNRSMSLGVDLIVITGDLVDGSISMRRSDVEPLGDLRAPDGVWVISGNHEYFFGHDPWMSHYAGLGMRVLANSHTVIRRGSASLILAGVPDQSARWWGNTAPDLDAALAGAPPAAPIILLDHQPRDARQAAARGVALQLSGHTHGGSFPGLDRLVALANRGYVSRTYLVDGMMLYVNNGTALWPGFALRLGRPSELTRFTLRRKP